MTSPTRFSEEYNTLTPIKNHLIFLKDFTFKMSEFFGNLKKQCESQTKKRQQHYQKHKLELSQLLVQKAQILVESKNRELFIKNKKQKKEEKTKKAKLKEAKKLLKSKDPLSPYFLFFRDYKNKIREQFPELKMVEISKLAGKLWNQLQSQERAKYIQLYETEKQHYLKQLQNLTSQKPQNKTWLRSEQELQINSQSQEKQSQSSVERNKINWPQKESLIELKNESQRKERINQKQAQGVLKIIEKLKKQTYFLSTNKLQTQKSESQNEGNCQKVTSDENHNESPLNNKFGNLKAVYAQCQMECIEQDSI